MRASGSSTADRHQLHILLRNAVLQELWISQFVRYQFDHKLREYCINISRSVRDRQVGTTTSLILGSYRDVRVAISCCHSWNDNNQSRWSWKHRCAQPCRAEGGYRIHLPLHLLFRSILGSYRLVRLLFPFYPNVLFAPTLNIANEDFVLYRVVTGEIFPLKVRAKSLSITTASNWLLNWAIAYSTPYLVNYGPGNANLQSKIFFIWGGCCFICIAFVYFMIYETKGLTLEQVDELYAEVSDARQSIGWVPTITFQEIRAEGKGLQHEEVETNTGEA